MNNGHVPPLGQLTDADLHNGVEANNSAIEKLTADNAELDIAADLKEANYRRIRELEEENERFERELEERHRQRP